MYFGFFIRKKEATFQPNFDNLENIRLFYTNAAPSLQRRGIPQKFRLSKYCSAQILDTKTEQN